MRASWVVACALGACAGSESGPAHVATAPGVPDAGGTAGPDTGPDTGGTAGPDTGGTAGPDTGGTAGPDTGGTAEVAEAIELAFAGDVMFGRYVEGGFRPIRAEKVNLFEHTAALLDSDFTVVNLETPVMRRPPAVSPYSTKMRFVTTPERVATLKAGNIDAVTTANNHAFDMRRAGIAETPAILRELGIEQLGEDRGGAPALRVETVDVRGWRVGFVAVTTERNWGEKKKGLFVPQVERDELRGAVTPVVAAARADHDLVIVLLHWGDEYEDAPDRWQVKAARAFVDAGADAVVAHHPHVLQGIERYQRGVIAYSLGNFVFDNLHGPKRLHGILRLRFRRDGRCLERAVFHPTVGTRPNFVPKPAGKELAKVAGRLRTLSKTKPLVATDWRLDGDRVVAGGTCSE